MSDADHLGISIDVPDEARVGAPIAVAVRVRNTSERAMDLYLRGREPTIDVVLEQGGRTAWRLLDGAVIPAIVRIETLAPGATLEIRAVVLPGALEVGTYDAHAVVLTEGPGMRTPSREVRIG